MDQACKRILIRFRKFMGYHENMDPYMKEMMPLLILYGLAARAPFKINAKGKVEANLISLQGLYFILTNGLLTYGTVEICQGLDMKSDLNRGPFASRLYVGSITVLIGLLHFSSVLSLLNKWAPTLDYIDEWAKLNVTFERVMGRRYAYKCKWIILITALVLPYFSVITVPLIIGQDYGTKRYHNYIPTIIFLSVTTEYVSILFTAVELMFMGSAINSKLKSLVKGNRLTAEKIHDLRRLWLRCSHVARLTGVSNTLQLILDLAGTIAVFSIANFALLASLVLGDFQVADYLICIACCWLRLFLFCEVGELTTNCVGSKIRLTISTAKIELFDARTANEVELFILNISSNYPNININGFTWVSRKVLFAIMGQSMLYIIVLIQLKMAR